MPELPMYSALRAVPSRSFPPGLAGMEQTASFKARAAAIQTEIRDPSRWPAEDRPLFIELLAPEGALVTVQAPDGDRCVIVFTTPFRAGDYVRTQLASGPTIRYLSSTPAELVRMLNDVRRGGIRSVAFDRCPRCDEFWAVRTDSIATPNDVLTLWSIAKSTEQARTECCLDYATSAAASGDLDGAREVLFEAVGHVSPDDPRLHFMLGQVAVACVDQNLLHEVKAHLSFLRYASWSEQLDQAMAAGKPMFGVR